MICQDTGNPKIRDHFSLVFIIFYLVKKSQYSWRKPINLANIFIQHNIHFLTPAALIHIPSTRAGLNQIKQSLKKTSTGIYWPLYYSFTRSYEGRQLTSSNLVHISCQCGYYFHGWVKDQWYICRSLIYVRYRNYSHWFQQYSLLYYKNGEPTLWVIHIFEVTFGNSFVSLIFPQHCNKFN